MLMLSLVLTPVLSSPLASEGALGTRVRSAALFKNGLAFVERAAGAPPGKSAIRIEGLPVHGTFWVAVDAEHGTLREARAERIEVGETTPARTIEDLLRANVGREVSLLVGSGEWILGRILDVASPPLPEAPDPRMGMIYAPTPPANLVLLDTATGHLGLSWTEVRRIAVAEGDLIREFEKARRAISLHLDLEGKSGDPLPLSVLYLGRGLTWVPSYAIDLTDSAIATVTAKAEVINEAEDLEGTTLRFVTGFPNLRFGHVPDPIAMQQDMQAFLASLSHAAPEADALMRQSVVYNVAAAEAGAGAFPTAPPPAEGERVEDLFLYERRDVTLARGERGLYPLFTVRAPYEHLYEWEIPDTIDEDPYRRAQRPEAPREEEIWHSVCITNESSLPWTTAPAMTMKEGRLLGQDVLRYAAVGAATRVRITRAVDVQGEQAEFETARERSAARFYGAEYDLVRVRGEIRARNLKREAVTLEITKRIQGEVKENPDEAEVVAEAKGLRRVNPNLRLTWSVPIEAGATRTLTYEYALYVRS